MEKLLVRDLMTKTVYAVRERDSLSRLRDLMDEHEVRHIPVVDAEECLVGLVSHRDLLRRALIEQDHDTSYLEEAALARLRVKELMTTNVESVQPDDELQRAARIMLEHHYGCLPVVEERRLVGILTESDFVRLQAEIKPRRRS